MEVKIRPLEERDAYESVHWRNDPEVFKYTGNIYTSEIKIETELQWIHKVIENNTIGSEFRCAIEVDGKYVGNIYLTDIKNGVGHYHIFIGDKSYWGKGVAKKASLLILYEGFNRFNLRIIELNVRPENKRAVSLYKSLGFIEVDRDNKYIKMKIEK